MSSLQQLNSEWKTLRDTLSGRIEQTDTGHIIYSESQFATAAWHNMLKAWHAELSDLLFQYPAPNRKIERASTSSALDQANL